ncbi:hypothetical protein KJ812_03235, partial [Patescibacteria group bacterium]|nr:hypothetical protein [Patescibacteria group bacterium]
MRIIKKIGAFTRRLLKNFFCKLLIFLRQGAGFIASRALYLALGIFLASSFAVYATWEQAQTGGSGELTEANWNELVAMIESEIGGGGLWTESGSDIYYDSGNVGIGTTGPGAPLQIGSYTWLGRGASWANPTLSITSAGDRIVFYGPTGTYKTA